MNEITNYYYVNPADLKPILKIERTDHSSGKKFLQFHSKDGDWKLGKTLDAIAPYAYEKWKDSKAPVYITEGEKCSERLMQVGLCATTTPGGANSWKPEFVEYFKNRDVIILPDNDANGKKYASTVLHDLLGVAKTLKVVELPHLSEKEDVFDYLQRHSVDEFNSEVQKSQFEQPTKAIGLKTENETDQLDALLAQYPINDLPPIVKEGLRLFSIVSDGSPIGCATAYFAVLSSLCGRQFEFQNTFLNDYYLLIGPSSIGRKTTIQTRAMDLLEGVLEYRDDLRINIPSKEPDSIGSLLTYSSVEEFTTFSVEGLEDATRGSGVSLFLAPQEYKSILTLGSRAGQSNTIPVLTGMYDGGRVKAIKRGQRSNAANYATTLLGASTFPWLKEMFSSDNIAGGFLNRHLVCYCKPSYPRKAIVSKMPADEWAAFIAEFSFLIPKRKTEVIDGNVHVSYDPIVLDFEDAEASSVFEKYSNELFEDLFKNNLNDTYLDIRGREETHAKKMAALHSVFRQKKTVDAAAIKFGISWACASSKTLLNLSGKGNNDSTHSSKFLSKIHQLYQKLGRPVMVSDIARATGGKQEENRNSLYELAGTKKIKMVGNGYVPVFSVDSKI